MSIQIAKFIGQKIRNEKNTQFSGVVTRIAIISVAFSVLVLLLSFSILEGFKTNIKNNIVSFASHIQVSKFDVNDNLENVPIPSAIQNTFNNVTNVDRVQVYGINTGILKVDDEVHGVVFKGIDVDFKKELLVKNILEGRFPKIGDSAINNEILISKSLQRKLLIKLNDNVIIYFITDKPKIRKLKIVGIYETGMAEFDEVFLIGDINLLRNVNKWDKTTVTGFEVFVKDFNKIDEAGNAVFEAMPNDMQMELITQKYIQIFDWFKVLDWNVVIFITIIIAVVGFNIVSTIVVMIMERTSMIGLLKSFGANNTLIGQIFFYYGLNILLKGLLLGNSIALIICLIQYHFKLIPLDPANYFMTSVPISWPWPTFMLVNLLIAFLTIIALLVPMLFISRVRPIKAIKFN